jgi:hypothetical protein
MHGYCRRLAVRYVRRELDLDVVALPDLDLEAALTAVASGTVDATFRGLTDAKKQLAGAGLSSALVIEDRHELLVGPNHRLPVPLP